MKDVIEAAINCIFHQYGTKREDYRGGNLNGAWARQIMDDFENIMHRKLFCWKVPGRLQTNLGTNYKQDIIWSPFNGLCCDRHNYIHFYIVSILNIQLHYQDLFECNCPLFLQTSYVWFRYVLQYFVAIFWFFAQNPKSHFIT